MKKILTVALLVLLMVVTSLAVVSCGNKDVFDTVYSYERAIVTLPDGTIIEGEVENWRDYPDGDQIQVKIDGKTYLVHSSNVVLISD